MTGIPTEASFPALLQGERLPRGIAEKGLLGLLKPLGALYGGLQHLRAHAYGAEWLTAYRPPVPTISVGSLDSGGTGKTPMVHWVVDHLTQQGRRPVIVSRGYRQRARAPVNIVSDGQSLLMRPPEAADEAVLLALKSPRTPVLTGPDRRLLIQAAIDRFPCDVVVMDDGFQHLRVKRDLDLVLLDAARPFGNGRILPAGALRERPSALKRAAGLLLTRADQASEPETQLKSLQNAWPGLPISLVRHRPLEWFRLDNGSTLPLNAFPYRRALPFCGLARPHSFARTLDALGVTAAPMTTFADHHPFDTKTLEILGEQARQQEADILVCTEKEAVKIDPAWSPLPLFVLRMGIHFPERPDWLIQAIDQLWSGRRAPREGLGGIKNEGHSPNVWR